jgi:hypothetical protein
VQLQEQHQQEQHQQEQQQLQVAGLLPAHPQCWPDPRSQSCWAVPRRQPVPLLASA